MSYKQNTRDINSEHDGAHPLQSRIAKIQERHASDVRVFDGAAVEERTKFEDRRPELT